MMLTADTVKLTPLLDTPFAVTTTFPVIAPAGTAATILVLLQLEGVAEAPLNATALEPCVEPKSVPVMVTTVPTGPEVGEREEIVGGVATVNGGAEMVFSPPTTAFG